MATRKTTPAEYDAWLAENRRGFVALQPYITASRHIKHQCPEGHPFDATPDHIKNGGGCTVCRLNKRKKFAEQYPKWLAQDGRGYVALQPYINNTTKIWHQCPAGHQWEARPNTIKSGKGCKDCAPDTTDANVFYIWGNAADTGVYKVGITSERLAEKRIKGCARKNRMKANIILMITVRDARDIESKALEIGEAVKYPSSIDGYTEFRRYTDHELGEVYRLAVRSA